MSFIYNSYYDATVLLTPTVPNASEAAVEPSAVSTIVPEFNAMFEPPTVNTSVLPIPADVFLNLSELAVDS